jgi:hypothetical protein
MIIRGGLMRLELLNLDFSDRIAGFNFYILLFLQLKDLLRNILDTYSSNKAKLIRERRYDDELQKYDRPHPLDAPHWSYVVQQQGLIYDTDFITEYEEEEVSRGVTPATGNNTENDDEDHNREEEEEIPSKSTVGDNNNNSDSDLHMDDA